MLTDVIDTMIVVRDLVVVELQPCHCDAVYLVNASKTTVFCTHFLTHFDDSCESKSWADGH